MANIQSVVGVDEYLDAEDGENNWSIKNLNAKLHCLFQIMTYHIHRGIKRHQCMSWLGTVHMEKTRSWALITTLGINHIGVSTSYNDIRRSHNHLSSYAVLASEPEDTPIPSHFTKADFCIEAVDNSDYADNSYLSGRPYTTLPWCCFRRQ